MKNLSRNIVVLALLMVAFVFTSPPTYAQNTHAGGQSGTIVNNQLIKSAGNNLIDDSIIADDGATATVAGAATITGKVTITRDPASTANTNASLVINPATSATNEFLFGALDNGTSKFTVDKEGDTVTAGNATITGTLGVTGASTLGVTGTGALTSTTGAFSSTLGVTGITTATGGVIVGSGGASPLKILTGTASVDFTALAAGTCENFNITVTGAVDGESVALGIPAAAWATTEYATIEGFVSTTNTVTVKRCNLTNATTALSNPAAVTIRATVFQF